MISRNEICLGTEPLGEEEGIHVIIIINIQSCRLPFLPLGDGKVHVAHYFIGGGD